MYLLSSLPMGQHSESETTSEEATESNAQAHLHYFREVFPYFEQEFDSWSVCLVAENASVNKKIARICEKPMIGCMSHRLNLDINDMVETDDDLAHVLEKVNGKMKETRSLKQLHCCET